MLGTNWNPNFNRGVIKGKCVPVSQAKLWSTEPRDSPRG